MTTDTNTTTIDPATVHEILSSHRRARVIEYLASEADERSEVPFEAIVEYLIERQGKSQAMKVTLRHQHLPLLNDVGVIEFDIETGVVFPSSECEVLHRAQKEVEAVVGD